LKGYLEQIALEQMGVARPLRKLVQLMDGKNGWQKFTLRSIFYYAIDVHAIDSAGSFDMTKFVSSIRSSIDVISDGQDNLENILLIIFIQSSFARNWRVVFLIAL